MNIFVVDKNPKIAARSLCDQHVVKMLIENCQMLSAVLDVTYSDKHRGDGGDPHVCLGLANYPKSVRKHPCTLWLMESINNVKWLIAHHREMIMEYTRRYGKNHKYEGTPMIYEAQLKYTDLPAVKGHHLLMLTLTSNTLRILWKHIGPVTILKSLSLQGGNIVSHLNGISQLSGEKIEENRRR